jgi:hypothetical protein
MKTKSVIFIDVNSEEASLIIDACQHTLSDNDGDILTEDNALYIRDTLLNGRRRLELTSFQTYKLLNILAYYNAIEFYGKGGELKGVMESMLDTLRDEVTFNG